MKNEFFQPRFVGARFAESTLPLEVAKDLAAYEILVIELAKELFIQEHPERQRVPKGFASNFNLHLERIDEGSAKPLLAVVLAGGLALGDGLNPYFERARDLISECVAAPDNQLPPLFPKSLLPHFNHVGRSLRADECIELPGPGGVIGRLTPDKRKRLVLASDRVYEREIELSGTIGEADWEKSTFRLRMMDGSQVIVPMPESFHAQARKYGGRNRHLVVTSGVGAFDSWDRLQKVVSVESIEIQANYVLSYRFDDLFSLQRGWYDGAGDVPNHQSLSLIAQKMVSHYPETLPLPSIIPTQDGQLLFEWNVAGDPSLDIDTQEMVGYFHSFGIGMGEIERNFALKNDDGWKDLFGFLQENLG